MSDEGERTCPLCAEEMDLTDQQLKPCKCGYEICVWCWHHIMDMAEKDETEGRCPACRTPYNKEKIVGTAASCERLVSEMNVEKKVKSQKGKSKTSEGRKQLASVRVIQRNLVYVVGLPLNFADEDLLQRREYFGQYGKVQKVSISRTAAGSIQQFANSTCSVYITYSREEEAVRCIQSVHGFVLDSRPLRACFGTTKYCHAWLRNVPCSNPDCLYLHEFGSQEDSFSKDEIISAYTRVQQMTGSSNTAMRRSGNMLPPPADEYCSNISASPGKPIIKTAVNTTNSAINARVSPPNSSSGRSAALPAGASWGTRPLSSQPLVRSTQSSNGPLKQKPDVYNGPVACTTAAASPSQSSSVHTDTEKPIPPKEKTVPQDNSKVETLEPVKKESNPGGRVTVPESSFTSVDPATLPVNKQPSSPPTTKLPPNIISVVDSSLTANKLALEEDSVDGRDGSTANICSDILSMDIHDKQFLENNYVQHIRGQETSQTSSAANTSEVGFLDVQSDRLGIPSVTKVDEIEDDLLSFNNQRLKDPEISANRIPDFYHPPHLSQHSKIFPSMFSDVNGSTSIDMERQFVDRNSSSAVSASNFHTGDPENMLKSPEANDVKYPSLFPRKEKMSFLGRYEGEASSGASDMGESSIISNILSIDFDPWDESLTSPRNLSKLLGETDKQQRSFGPPGPRKVQNGNQSRFSFAREEPLSQVSDFGQFNDYVENGFKQRPFGNDFSNSNGLHLEKLVSRNGFPVSNGFESEIFAGSLPSNRNSGSRSQISAPPGFSVPNRAPPPGFTSYERTDQTSDTVSGNHIHDASIFLRNHYQTLPGGNTVSNSDIEFMDPAILAVGKGTVPSGINGSGMDLRSNYSSQLYEEARLQSFLQRSLPQHQNQRFNDLGNNGFSHLGDAYGVPSRVMEQTLANNLPQFSQFSHPQSRNGITSNAQWDSWNEVQGGTNLGIADLLRTQNLGFNKFYGGYEDSKTRMPGSGNLFNGTYGI